MTDPMTNMEIEDVLSSIRRLVSENKREENQADKGDPKPKAEVADADEPHAEDHLSDAAGSSVAPDVLDGDSHRPADQTLVLTPALRVQQPDESGEEDFSQPMSEDGHWDAGDVDRPESAQDAATEMDAETSGELNIEAQDDGDIASIVQDALEEHAETPEDEVDDAPLTLSPTFRHAEPDTTELENRIAGLEAAVAEREDDWEPDGINESDNAAAPVDSLTWEDDEAPGRGWDAAEVVEIEEAELVEEAESAEVDVLGDSEGDTSTSALASELEAELASIAALTGAMRSAATANVEPAGKAADAVEEAGADDDEPAGALLGDTDAVLDEEMLRELVAEIVRQELQGRLGERITRNVRKLVRREIHRALTARDME